MHNHAFSATAAFTIEVARILLEREKGHLRENNFSDTIINQLKGYKKLGSLC